jgi:hypothetical protein
MDDGDREVGTMSLSEVSNILWRERRLLELLMFKVEEEQLLLASGRTRWLSHATHEVEMILEEIKRIELERAMAVAGAPGELGISDTPSLRELAAIAPSPWDGIFGEHRRALLALAQEIDAIAKSNSNLFRRGQQATREALASPGAVEINAGGRSGAFGDRSAGLRLVDPANLTSEFGGPVRCIREGRQPREPSGKRSVQTVDVARISQAGINSDEEIEMTTNPAEDVETRQNLSNVEDVDLAQVLMNLQAQETTYQSALAAAAKAIQPTLAAFLQ